MTAPEKGLLVQVYRSGDRETSQLGNGIPRDADTVLLLCEGGIVEPKPGQVVLEVVHRPNAGRYARIVGSDDKDGPWMDGGTFVGSHDSRVREAIGFYGALPVHDRQETWEMYERMSR